MIFLFGNVFEEMLRLVHPARSPQAAPTVFACEAFTCKTADELIKHDVFLEFDKETTVLSNE